MVGTVEQQQLTRQASCDLRSPGGVHAASNEELRSGPRPQRRDDAEVIEQRRQPDRRQLGPERRRTAPAGLGREQCRFAAGECGLGVDERAFLAVELVVHGQHAEADVLEGQREVEHGSLEGAAGGPGQHDRGALASLVPEGAADAEV